MAVVKGSNVKMKGLSAHPHPSPAAADVRSHGEQAISAPDTSC